MSDTPDAELLEQFARNGSETAFAQLVQRHIALVHSVALRHTANPEHARDITQAVFIILSRKAASLGRKTVLPGWLYHAARLTAANFQRAEARRVRREQEAYMQSIPEENPADAVWRELSPRFEEAMACLAERERDALVLRYFQNKSIAEMGQSLGLEENTAQKRVSRGLEKLRKFFARRGVGLSTAVIAGAISAHSVQAAPAGLAVTVSATALKGPAVAASTLALVKGTLKVMAWLKSKALIAISAGTVLTGAAILTIQAQEEQNRRQEQAIREQEQQIREQEQQPGLPPDQRKQLEDRLNVLRAQQNKLRAAQDQLRAQDVNPLANPSAQISPFTKVRFEGDRVLVTYLGEESELDAVNGVSTTDLLKFSAHQYGQKTAKKHFAEDMVVLLATVGHPASAENCVSLTLMDSKTGQTKSVDHAAMTSENRQAVYNALPPEIQ